MISVIEPPATVIRDVSVALLQELDIAEEKRIKKGSNLYALNIFIIDFFVKLNDNHSHSHLMLIKIQG